MTETNPFRYYLPNGTNRLIIGSFPCYNGNDYGDWYYSGSGRNHFWQLMSDVFQMPAGTRKEKKRLCEVNKIGLTDVAYKIKRNKGNCSDLNLEIKEFNLRGIKKCLAVKTLEQIFFTSKFVEKHFLKIFPDTGIPCVVLPSPSPAANKHIGGLEDYKKLKGSGQLTSAYHYRLVKYREALLR